MRSGILHLCALLPDMQAYLLFTSGSTGEPKGVCVVHRGLLNLLLDMQRTFAVGSQDRLLSVTTPTFDISFLEYLLPLISGASLYLTEAERAADSFRMIPLIADYRPTLMQATPSFWHGLLMAGWRGDRNYVCWQAVKRCQRKWRKNCCAVVVHCGTSTVPPKQPFGR